MSLQSHTARVYIDRTAGQVVKEVHRYTRLGVVQREASWLSRLGGYGCFPTLLGVQGNRIWMTYEGEPVAPESLPGDWQSQAGTLISILAFEGCAHNDIKPGDILVNADGQLRLIDFQWATEIGAPVPEEWPPGIGSGYRAPHAFDDAFSLNKALSEVATCPRQP